MTPFVLVFTSASTVKWICHCGLLYSVYIQYIILLLYPYCTYCTFTCNAYYSTFQTSTGQTDQVVSCSVAPALHPSRDVQMSIPHQNSPSPGTVNQSTLTGPLQSASSQYLSSSGPPQQSYPPPVPQWPAQPMPVLLSPYVLPPVPGMVQQILPFPNPRYGHISMPPVQYSQPPSHPSHSRSGSYSGPVPFFTWGFSGNTPPPPQGPLPTEDLPGPSSLSYPPQYCEPHPTYPSTHYSHRPTLCELQYIECTVHVYFSVVSCNVFML